MEKKTMPTKKTALSELEQTALLAQQYKELYLEREALNEKMKEMMAAVTEKAKANEQWFADAKSFELVDGIKLIKKEDSSIELDSLLTDDDRAAAVKKLMTKYPKAVKVSFLKSNLKNVDLASHKLTELCKPAKYDLNW